jgi:hypothetical protein
MKKPPWLFHFLVEMKPGWWLFVPVLWLEVVSIFSLANGVE